MTEGPAMSRDEAVRAVETGIEIVEAQIQKGYRVFLWEKWEYPIQQQQLVS